MNNLRGCNAIITGASRGIGAHIARALAAEGVHLALVARSADALAEVREQVLEHDVKAVIIPADLSNTAQLEAVVGKAENELGPTDILINNAGVEYAAPYQEYPIDQIRLDVQLNLLAAMLLSNTVLPGMLLRGRGHIVNISSLAGKIGFPYQTPYAATKAGLNMFTHSLRVELADTPVGVSVICPGYVDDFGMFSRRDKTGVTVPKMLKPTTTDKVVAAVIRAIRKDIAEITVNALPVRPLTLLRELGPGTTSFIHKATGNTRFIRELLAKSSHKSHKSHKKSSR